MCPDGQILSVFFDGEVPSPWKESIEQHVAQCESCRTKLASYKQLSSSLHAEDSAFASIENKQDAMWHRIQQQHRAAKYLDFWHRKFAIPAPLVAAAAVIIMVFLGANVFVSLNKQNQAMVKTLPATSPIAKIEASNERGKLEAILQLLNEQDLNQELVIDLPQEPQFSIVGEPQLLRAVEYAKGAKQ